MDLIIVESPTKSRTLQSFLSKQYKVLSSFGHVRDLPKKELGVDIENDFKPNYVVPPRAKKTISLLKKDAAASQKIILATDEDREGESIAWHLTQALGLGNYQDPNSKIRTKLKTQIQKSKLYQRIAFHEITEDAIKKALENPRDIDMNMVNAQQTRRILDRIVGYKISPFLWKKVARGLSAGRVQSVAVRLVAEREREIKDFLPQEYWSIEAELKKQDTRNNNQAFTAQLAKKDGGTLDKLDIKNKKDADKIIGDLEGAEYKVINVEKKETKKNPLPPFTTSTLQQTAWQKFKWPAKLTMQIAQQLYEKGLTSYHRTDSLNLSDLALATAKKLIINNFGQDYYQFRKYKTKSKTAQEAHEAIRPTYSENTPEKIAKKLEKNQFKLYDLIWRRFIACQMASAVFNAVSVDISANNPAPYRNSSGAEYGFRSNGQTLKFDGSLKVYPIKFSENELPTLEKNEILNLVKLLSSQHFTEPPPRYNEASLIKALEENGIGRPSTYAPILSTIQERNYIVKNEQKRFEPTEIGTVVNDVLVEHFPEVVDIQFTAKMEKELDEVAEGKDDWVKTCRDFYTPFAKNLEEKYKEVSKKSIAEKETDKICPECGARLLMRLGRYGNFYACSRFPKCKYTESLKNKILGIKCPKCGQGMITEKRTRKHKIFYGCDQFPKCDFALWDKPLPGRQAGTGEKCPECGSLMVETKRKQIKCSNKNCQSNKKVIK